jgi:hypothetical protein
MAAAKNARPAPRKIASSTGTSVSRGSIYAHRHIGSMRLASWGNIGGIYGRQPIDPPHGKKKAAAIAAALEKVALWGVG